MIFQLVNFLTHYHIQSIFFKKKLCSCSCRQVYFETYKVNFSYRHFNSCKASSAGRNSPSSTGPSKRDQWLLEGPLLFSLRLFSRIFTSMSSLALRPPFRNVRRPESAQLEEEERKKGRKRDGFLLRLLFPPHGITKGGGKGEGSGHGSLGLSVPFPAAPKVRPLFRGVSASSTYAPGDS